MFLIKSVSLAVGGLAMATTVAGQPCGTFTGAAEHLIEHREVFEGAEWADERAALGINAIDPGDPVEVVTDVATCESLVSDLRADLNLPDVPDPSAYAIYRYGAYYAIELLAPGQVDDTFYHADERLEVYTVGQGQKLKGSVRVG